jgi:flagellar L-ring protein precursor FlgH
MQYRTTACIIALLLVPPSAICKQPRKDAPSSSIDDYIAAVEQRNIANGLSSAPGSTFNSASSLVNSARDLRAAQVDDIVTIVVADRASAASKGVTNSSRKSSAKYGVDSLYGPLKAPWVNLAGATGDRQLQGQGETSRENNLTTTVAARVTHVLPNGNLIVQGTKTVTVNSENQLVRVRGIVRPADISPANIVRSERLAELDIEINGRGVVGDAIKRPFILYRILMGLLPF